MKMRTNVQLGGGLLLGLVLLFCQATTVLGADDAPFSVSLGFDFASGDYGTSQTTDSYSIPLYISYYPSDRLDFHLEIPYLYQSNSSTVSLGGMRFPMQGSGSTSGSGMGGGRTASVTDSQSGLGDISLTAGYVLSGGSGTAPMIRPLVYLKLPTADKDKGLGTGAFDFGAGLSVGTGFGNWSVYAEALYILPGSTSAYNPDNYWTYLGSVYYQLTRKFEYGFALSGATAAFVDNPDALEVQLKSSYQLSSQWNLGAYLGKGLSDSSADYTTGFYWTVSF